VSDIPQVRYFVIDSATGLSFHNFFSKQDALEASMRMEGDYHIGKEYVNNNGTPAPFKEEEYHG